MRNGSLLIVLLVVFWMSACSSSSESASVNLNEQQADGDTQPAIPEPIPTPEPPPLLPPLEEGESLDSLMQRQQQAKRQAPPQPPESRETTYLYCWKDEKQTEHCVSEESDIPKQYLENTRRIRRGPSTHRGPNDRPVTPEEIMKEDIGQQIETQREQYRQRYKALVVRLEQARSKYQLMKDNPPACAAVIDPRLAGENYDPNCEQNYKKGLQQAKAQVEQAEKNIEDLRDEARRNSIPPGYLR